MLQQVGQAAPAQRDFSLWTLLCGVVYGLQPDALFVIIPALALPTPLAAVAYMSMFVVGTVTAMGSYTAFLGEACLRLSLASCIIGASMRGLCSMPPLPESCLQEGLWLGHHLETAADA